jgi:hypothetical protein
MCPRLTSPGDRGPATAAGRHLRCPTAEADTLLVEAETYISLEERTSDYYGFPPPQQWESAAQQWLRGTAEAEAVMTIPGSQTPVVYAPKRTKG